MSFVAKLQRAREVLEQQGRLSLRALRRELELEGDELEEVVDELVEIQRVATREGRALVWTGELNEPPGTVVAERSLERDPRDYTPKHLADKILQSKSALEGERKQVTVLFADVKGSTELAQGLDPEAWYGISDRFLQILAEGVHRFEGTVNQFTGDGIMALFGAPIAHEDHGQRACYAALHLRDELKRYGEEVKRTKGVVLAFRMGLNSGEVVVGKIGDDLRMDYTAAGFTTNVADRMQKLADPGTVYLSESTRRLVEGYFELRDLGPFEIKGVSEPVPTFELQGVGPLRSRFDVSRARGLSRFVGRSREMAVLDEALAAVASGQSRIVGIVGEAGVGKSRLVHEFLERVGPSISSFKGQCAPHTQSIPLLPIMEALRERYGITHEDSAETCRVKITGFLLRVDPALAADVPFVLDFLGVRDPEQPGPELEPTERIERLIRIANAVLRNQIQRGLYGIRVIEDLHWMDDATEAYLVARDSQIQDVGGLLSIFTYRREYEPPFSGGSHFRELALRPLSSELIDELLRDLLGPRTASGPLSEMIRSRSGGNPFFVEEIVVSLVESGALVGPRGDHELTRPIAELHVPDSVQALLAARIDRLSEREKAVLQAASVIGASFPEDQLREITDLPEADLRDALQALASAELVYETAVYPRVEYAFKHAQTRDVAYDSQLQDARARTHAAVARSIESLRAEHMEENYALLAHHWERAREPLTAAAWSLRAAGWARYSDVAEAVRHYRRVLELVGEATGDRELEKLVLGACIGLLTSGLGAGLEEGEPPGVLERGRAAATVLGSRRQLVELLTAYGRAPGKLAVAAEAREALRLAEEIGDLRLLGRSRLALAQSLWSLEREFRAALDLLEATLADDATNWRALALHGRLLAETGRLDDAQVALDRAAGLLSPSSPARWVELEPRCATLDVRRGDFEAANRRAARCLEHSERHMNRFGVVQPLQTLGECAIAAGRYGEAIELLERAREHSRSLHVAPWAESLHQPLRVLAYTRVGDRDRARELLEFWRALGSPSHPESRARIARAMIELSDLDELNDAEAYLDEIERLTAEEGTLYYRAPHQECRAALARRREDEEGRLHHLREAHRLYTEMGATGHAERLAKEFGL